MTHTPYMCVSVLCFSYFPTIGWKISYYLLSCLVSFQGHISTPSDTDQISSGASILIFFLLVFLSLSFYWMFCRKSEGVYWMAIRGAKGSLLIDRYQSVALPVVSGSIAYSCLSSASESYSFYIKVMQLCYLAQCSGHLLRFGNLPLVTCHITFTFTFIS